MRIAGLVLGIIGGLAGIVGGIIVVAFGGIGEALAAEGAATVTNLGFAAIPAGIVGLVGGALSVGKPKVAGILMLISAVAGIIFISAGYALAAILLIVGGILALLGQKEIAKDRAV